MVVVILVARRSFRHGLTLHELRLRRNDGMGCRAAVFSRSERAAHPAELVAFAVVISAGWAYDDRRIHRQFLRCLSCRIFRVDFRGKPLRSLKSCGDLRSELAAALEAAQRLSTEIDAED